MKQKTVWIWLSLWTIFIFVLCTMPTDGVDAPKLILHLDKIVHFGLFLIFTVLLYNCLQGNWGKKTCKILIVLFVLGLYGAVIEYLQGEYFQRSADIWDWVADMIGGITGILCYSQIQMIREKILRIILQK